ncbi:hypothetical protein DUNSADRAFT_8537, partial [Dunaliella salina]
MSLHSFGSVLGGSRTLVSLRLVVDNVLERLHAEFGQLLQVMSLETDENRKHLLLSYFHSARQQLLRLVAIVTWSPKSKALMECVDHGKVLDVAR